MIPPLHVTADEPANVMPDAPVIFPRTANVPPLTVNVPVYPVQVIFRQVAPAPVVQAADDPPLKMALSALVGGDACGVPETDQLLPVVHALLVAPVQSKSATN